MHINYLVGLGDLCFIIGFYGLMVLSVGQFGSVLGTGGKPVVE